MTKSYYLTVRCQDCECWLHPRAVPSHEVRCPGRPWIADTGRTTLVTGELAEQLRRLLPEDLLGRPTFSAERLLSPGPGEFLRPEVCRGIVVASPVPGVSSRVWAQIARAGLREGGESALRQAMTVEGFAELRAQLGVDLVECAHCGQALTEKGLTTHQRTNVACRWGRAVAQVRDMWGPRPARPVVGSGGAPGVGRVEGEGLLAPPAGGRSLPEIECVKPDWPHRAHLIWPHPVVA